MYEEEYAKQAQRTADMCAKAAQGGGYATLDEPCRPGIRERIENDLNRANREARKVEALHELSFLLNKNPEVARIIDLIEIVRS